MTQPSQFPLQYDSARSWLRPKSVTVVSVIGICWASLSLLCQGLGLLIQSLHEGAMPGQPPVQPVVPTTAVAIALSVGSLVMAILLLVACIAALRIISWAPRLALFYGVVGLILTFGSTAWLALAFDPSAMKLPPPRPGATTLPASTVKAMTTFIFESAVVGGLILGSIMPVTMLITFGRRSIRDFYAGIMPSDPYGRPPQTPGDFPPPPPPGAWPPPPQ